MSTKLLKSMLRPILRRVVGLLFRVEVTGKICALGAQRLLIIANHQSFLDGLILALFLPLDPVFVIHTHVAENPWCGWPGSRNSGSGFWKAMAPRKPRRPVHLDAVPLLGSGKIDHVSLRRMAESA